MNDHVPADNHVQSIETVWRLYVFLAEELDRSRQARRETFLEQELRDPLSSTRAKAMEILSVNPMVKEKVDNECQRALALAADCLAERNGKSPAATNVQAEEAVLK